MRLFFFGCFSIFIVGCGDSNDDEPTPLATPTSLVSFSVADAPADSVTSVNVTFNSITLKAESDDDNDSSGIVLPLLNESGEATAMTIDLMDYQDGDKKLIIDSVNVPVGTYKSLVINTLDCPQNPNGDTTSCWVVDADGDKPLKTPSNKLKLGAITISTEEQQAYTIEFNLRASLTATANGSAYNLKPHGVRIVNNDLVGQVSGTVDVNLLTAGENCQMVFDPNADHGKIVYLYQSPLAENSTLGDEFDPEETQENDIANVAMPYASDKITFDGENYHYSFAHLPAGEYLIAFSCSAVGDNAE